MITVCMMVKNEEEFLSMCLEHNSTGIVRFEVIDTGSTDKTMDILHNHLIVPCQVSFTNYSDVRNMLLNRVETSYALMLDGDETIPNHLDCGSLCKDIYALRRIHYLGNGYVYSDTTARIIRKGSGIQYVNAIFESAQTKQDVVLLRHVIHHFGYIKRSYGEKLQRYIAKIRDEMKCNDRPVLYSMMALCQLLIGNTSYALKLTLFAMRHFPSPWFYLLSSDIFRAREEYQEAIHYLQKGLMFCDANIKDADSRIFYKKRMYNKLSVLHIMCGAYDYALFCLNTIDEDDYSSLLNKQHVYKKMAIADDYQRVSHIISQFPFEKYRLSKRNDGLFIQHIADNI